MSAKFTRQMVTYNEMYAAVLGNTGTIFRVLRPGLTNQESTVSMMSLDKPGWFLRHFHGSVYLEPRVNPRGPDTFDMDATFYERENRFFEGYFAFESVNAKDAYVVCNSSGALSVEANENTTDFSERASFAIVESDSSTSGNARRRRKRLAGKVPKVSRKFAHTDIDTRTHPHTRSDGCKTNNFFKFIYCIFSQLESRKVSIAFSLSVTQSHSRSITHSVCHSLTQ